MLNALIRTRTVLVAGVVGLVAGATTAFAHEPIPDAAWGPPVDPAKGYHVEEMGGGLYWVTDGIYQVMFLTTGEGVIAVDAPPTLGQNYLAAIAEVTELPVTHVIYSHSHADHIGAAGIFPAGATYIAHEDVAAHLQSAATDPRPAPFGVFVGGGPVPVPTVTFSDEYTLTVGGQTLELAYKGPAHEPGNIFIFAPAHQVLMLVDVVFPGWTPFKGLAEAEHTPAYMRAHDQILEYDFDTFIGGHMGRLGTRRDVEIQREYMFDMTTNAAAGLQSVDFNAVAGELQTNNLWLLFDTYLESVARMCTEATLAKWATRLAAADVFTSGHCFRVVMSLRID